VDVIGELASKFEVSAVLLPPFKIVF